MSKKQIEGTEGVEPWHLIGWLSATIERDRKITIKDWNDAIEASRQAKIANADLVAKIRAERGLSDFD